MIRSFADKDAKAFFAGKRVRRFNQFGDALARKLTQLDEAEELRDLASIPGNRLERLHDGTYSVRINVQMRIVFRWTDDGPADVKVEDYH
ncbi:MAG TPA: type II toxin-antitoxin system RelE/ParE family toxin [Candidatus Baltobacteraceae bacterium]|nr:type II toxin-antitoxin system RelE/ParE family toxin [Candidatus Baltobacteraceae bacterium]